MHTPGPWTTEVLQELKHDGERMPASYISSSQGWANSGMAGRRTIAIVGHWKDRPNPEDDARLIAAAPEQNAALIDLVALVKRVIPDADMLHEVQNATEAIRKAKSHADTLKGE